MPFHFEPMPERGKPVEVAPGVLRLVANNPTPMTYHGTNTYLIEGKGGVYVLDPGPANDEAHAKAIIEAVGVRAAGIIVSHHHSDHFGLVPYLQQVLNVRVFASASFADDTFRPDVALQDGDEVTGLQVLHTPGHASDHLCLGRDDGVLFTGDHVMTWNSSIVIPPDGNMGSYCAQLERLATRDDKLYLPGHGPPLADPIPYAHSCWPTGDGANLRLSGSWGAGHPASSSLLTLSTGNLTRQSSGRRSAMSRHTCSSFGMKA